MTPTQPPVQTDDVNALDYLRPILSRKWMLLAIVTMVTSGTFAYYSRQPDLFEASTKIFVGSDRGTLEQSALPSSDRTIQNQATLLQSREVAENVAERLDRPGQEAALSASVEALPSTGSDFVLVQARRASGADAALVANTFASEFVRLRDRQRRAEVNQALDEARRQLDRLPGGQSNEAARSELAETVRRLELELAVPPGSARQIDPALAPGAPVEPRPARNALFGFVLSLLVAVGLAFGLERFDRRLKRVEDVADHYDLPVLALLPHVDERQFSIDGEPAMGPSFEEPFRQLRTNVQLAALDRPFKRILVTSAGSGEGKSTVVRNLAIAFREWGHRVAVVDADLRRPMLSTLFDQQPDGGLTEVLTGQRNLEDALVVVKVHARGLETLAQMDATPSGGVATRTATVITANGAGDIQSSSTISLLGSGSQPANPQAVLAARQMETLLTHVGQEHDIVLIDSPPLLAVTDAVPLISEADAVIVVSRLGLTTREGSRRFTEFIGRIPGAHPIGVVVNDLQSLEGSGSRYGSYYGTYGYTDRS